MTNLRNWNATISDTGGPRIDDERVQRLADQGKTVVIVMLDDQVIDAIALADIVRKESYTPVERLKNLNIQCVYARGGPESGPERLPRRGAD